MFRPFCALGFPVLLAACLQAGEVTVEPRPFDIEAVFNATVMPDGDVTLLRLDAKSWDDFRILELAGHGARAAKGDLLASFDAEEIDRKLEDTRRALESGALAEARAELELKVLEETAPRRLEAARRAAEIAREENSYFTATRRKAEEETASQKLVRKKQLLSDQQEELKQLTKMYAADDVIEDTEEIILTRQKDDVASAEFAVRMEELDCKRTLEVSVPREAVVLADAERDTATSLRSAAEEIPRSIELKKLELASLKTSRQRQKQALAELEHDRALFEWRAPAAGLFYYGPVENGRWTPGDIAKALVKNGRVPAGRPFATFIPAACPLGLTAFLDDSTARSLQAGTAGSATLAGREDVEIPVRLVRLAAAPGPDGTYRADLSATWPREPAPVIGATAEVRVVFYHQPAAIVIPAKALVHDSNGWTAEVKLADGKTERRPVTRGRVSKEGVEIRTGLDEGQVVIEP